jgi:hypothetical protein
LVIPLARKLSSCRRRPRKGGGTLKPATAVKTSGLNIAACQATGAPQSWPTIAACFSPSSATSATMSPTVSKMVYALISADALVRPNPRISGATTWKPAAAIAGI